jgi:hypothetical protein
MKRIFIIMAGLVVSSFIKPNAQTDLQEQHLKGRVKTITYFIGKDTTSVVEFNNAGNISEAKYYSQGKVDDICHYRYDQQNKLMETNSVSWRTIYSYDANNDLTETRRYKVEDSGLMERVLFKKDSKGNDSVMISYAGHDGSMNYRALITIAANGDREEIEYATDGIIQRKEETVYDANHFLSTNKKYVHLWGMEYTESSKFHYINNDKAGNWTEDNFLRNRTASEHRVQDWEEHEKRVIEYY